MDVKCFYNLHFPIIQASSSVHCLFNFGPAWIQKTMPTACFFVPYQWPGLFKSFHARVKKQYLWTGILDIPLEATKFNGGDSQGYGFQISEKNIRYWHKCKWFSLFLSEFNLLWRRKDPNIYSLYFPQHI